MKKILLILALMIAFISGCITTIKTQKPQIKDDQIIIEYFNNEFIYR